MPTAADFQAWRDAYNAVAPDPAHFDEFAARMSAMVHEFPGMDRRAAITAGADPADLRRPQFAKMQPSAAGRIDLGLILGDVPPDARLESVQGFNALFTHRVRLSSTADIDSQLIGWLQRAYDRA
jgi:hypothetical protein